MRQVFNDGSPIWLKTISGLLIFALAFAFINAIGGRVFAGTSAETDLRAAQESYQRALAGHCSIIGAKVQDCYTGGDCASLKTSIDWFMSEDGYGQPPEIACVNRPVFD